MQIEIKEVVSSRDRRKFIRLPASIHKTHKNWLPSLYIDDRQFFNPARNKAFTHSDTILLLAYRDRKLVGRIMGVINHKYNDAHDLKEGRFSFLETYDDFEVAKALLHALENWARGKGMEQMVGPLAFSDKDPQGLLIEGYEQPVVIATNCNFPYLVDFVERSGYTKKVDLFDYKLMIPEVIPEFYRRIHERAVRNNLSMRLLEFTKRKELRPYIVPLFRLVNEAYKDIYAFAALDEKEMTEFANRYLMILDPHFIKVVKNGSDEIIAFIIAMPDISEGIRKCRGRVIPFGIFQIFRSQQRTNQLDLLLGAIKEEYRNTGIDTIMGLKILEEAKRKNKEFIDSHLILETNVKMRAELEKLNGKVYKRFRIFSKPL